MRIPLPTRTATKTFFFTLALTNGVGQSRADSVFPIEFRPGTARGSWSAASPMPTARSEIASALHGGKIYVVGGVSLGGSMNQFESYEIATNRWTKLPPLPTKLNHTGVATAKGKVYVSGGYLNLRQTRFSEFLYAYDIEASRWTRVASMPGNRYKHFMIHRDGWLHLIGGLHQKDTWSYHLRSGRWHTNFIAPLPRKRDHIAVLQNSRHLYVVGGRRERIAEADCWRYDFRDRAWKVFTRLPLPRGAPTAVLSDKGRIHVVGGEDLQTKKVYRRHDIYDLATGTWSEGPPLPRERHGMTSCRFDGNWYVIGGGRKAEVGTIFSATRALEVYSLQ